jgi:hypothetical protein
MESREFDRITRLAAHSRRGVLRALGGGAVAAVAAGLGLRGAAASKARSVGNACKLNADCVSGRCVPQSPTRKICGCVVDGDCPTPSNPCATAVCTPDGTCGSALNESGTACGAVCCDADQLCAGGACVAGQGTCAAGADFCATSVSGCNGQSDCFCRATTESDTRCGGNNLGGECGECSSSADCATLYPGVPGAFCLKGGTGCCDGTAPNGLCTAPCPSI